MILNPAATVRGPRYQTVEGKTPEISIAQARRLLASIDASHAVGLRDRAILGVLAYTAARVGAIAKLRRRHYIDMGEQRVIRFVIVVRLLRGCSEQPRRSEPSANAL